MKTQRMFSLVMAVAVAVGCAAIAFAAEAPSGTPAPTANPAPAAKPVEPAKGVSAPRPRDEFLCDVSGRLDSKMIKDKSGKEIKVFELTVAQAKGADGKPMADLKGKEIYIGEHKGVDILAHVGKEVNVHGRLLNHRRLIPDSIT